MYWLTPSNDIQQHVFKKKGNTTSLEAIEAAGLT